jgi:hypothetical protein
MFKESPARKAEKGEHKARAQLQSEKVEKREHKQAKRVR